MNREKKKKSVSKRRQHAVSALWVSVMEMFLTSGQTREEQCRRINLWLHVPTVLDKSTGCHRCQHCQLTSNLESQFSVLHSETGKMSTRDKYATTQVDTKKNMLLSVLH